MSRPGCYALPPLIADTMRIARALAADHDLTVRSFCEFCVAFGLPAVDILRETLATMPAPEPPFVFRGGPLTIRDFLAFCSHFGWDPFRVLALDVADGGFCRLTYRIVGKRVICYG